jgi:hypothetical protein
MLRSMRVGRALLVIPGFVTACATAPPPADPVAALRSSAAVDMSCPAHLLRVTPLGEETFGPQHVPLYQQVEGCGMHVIYVAHETGYVMGSPKPTPARGPDHVDVR